MDAAAAYCCRYFQNENVEYILLSRSELDFAPYRVVLKVLGKKANLGIARRVYEAFFWSINCSNPPQEASVDLVK